MSKLTSARAGTPGSCKPSKYKNRGRGFLRHSHNRDYTNVPPTLGRGALATPRTLQTVGGFRCRPYRTDDTR